MSQQPNLFCRLIENLLTGWGGIFATYKGHALAAEYALDFITSNAPSKTIASVLEEAGKGQQNHKPYYDLFGESPWNPDQLFQPVIEQSAKMCLETKPKAKAWLAVAMDDTLMKKSSYRIPGVRTARDPMSLPFHTNLVRGMRILQASAIIPHYTTHNVAARAYPVASRVVAPVKKPGKNASAGEVAQWKEEKKQRNLNTAARDLCTTLRKFYDQTGWSHARLLMTTDNSYCNRSILKEPIERVDFLSRCRKDARLCYPAAEGSRRKYDHDTAFTPEDLRKDEAHGWKPVRVFYGGKWRKVQIKVVRNIRWQNGAGPRPLTLIVIKPREFRPSRKSKTYYKDPVYLLTAAVDICPKYAVRAYFGRGGIEDNFRDEKSVVGVNDAQVWSCESAPRYIPFATAVYSLALMASLAETGPTRTEHYHQKPRWYRRPQTRPSARDIIKALRADRARLESDGAKQDQSIVCNRHDIRLKLAQAATIQRPRITASQ